MRNRTIKNSAQKQHHFEHAIMKPSISFTFLCTATSGGSSGTVSSVFSSLSFSFFFSVHHFSVTQANTKIEGCSKKPPVNICIQLITHFFSYVSLHQMLLLLLVVEVEEHLLHFLLPCLCSSLCLS